MNNRWLSEFERRLSLVASQSNIDEITIEKIIVDKNSYAKIREAEAKRRLNRESTALPEFIYGTMPRKLMFFGIEITTDEREKKKLQKR